MRTRSSFVIQAFLSLLIGAFLYVAFRPEDLPLISFLSEIGLGTPIAVIRDALAPLTDKLPPWTIYSLPSALWCYALTLSLGALWHNSHYTEKWGWMAVPIVLSILVEIGQLSHYISGVFDPNDIVTSLLAWMIGLYFISAAAHR